MSPHHADSWGHLGLAVGADTDVPGCLLGGLMVLVPILLLSVQVVDVPMQVVGDGDMCGSVHSPHSPSSSSSSPLHGGMTEPQATL